MTLLQQIRDRVHHPATARELAQILRIPREERAAFKRQLKALVTAGELLQVRGNRFGVPDKMDVVVGTLVHEPPRLRLRRAGTRLDSGRSGKRKDVYIASTESPRGDARRSRRRAGRAGDTERARGANHPHSRAWQPDHRRPIRDRPRRSWLRRAVRQAGADGYSRPDRPVIVRRTRRDGAGRDHAVADSHARSGRTGRRGVRARRRTRRRHADHHPQVRHSRHAFRGSRGGGPPDRRRRQGAGHPRAHRFPQGDHGHHRWRACARLRRCDHHRAAAERQLLARGAHR